MMNGYVGCWSNSKSEEIQVFITLYIVSSDMTVVKNCGGQGISKPSMVARPQSKLGSCPRNLNL